MLQRCNPLYKIHLIERWQYEIEAPHRDALHYQNEVNAGSTTARLVWRLGSYEREGQEEHSQQPEKQIQTASLSSRLNKLMPVADQEGVDERQIRAAGSRRLYKDRRGVNAASTVPRL